MTAQKHKEPKEKTTQTGQKPEKGETTLGFTGLLGIVLLAGALFNVPAIMKVPVTTEDKMMLVVVIAMAIGGAVLLIFRKKN